jgi:hypothetical protein
VEVAVGARHKCCHQEARDRAAAVAGTDKVAAERHWDEHRR